MQRVLVAADGSEHDEAAMRWATSVARRTGAELVAVSAWQPEQAELPPGESEFEHARRRTQVSAVLDRVASTTPHRTEVVDGAHVRVLVSEQTAEAADLLVVALPGAAGSARRIGTTAEVIARRTTAPLAAVPAAVDAEIRCIVLGVDASDDAKRATEWCASFASAVGAEVVATSVITPELEMLAELEGAGTRAWLSTQQRWLAPLHDAGVPTRVSVVRDDDVARTLARVAEQEGADVIIVGLEGLARGLNRRLPRNAARLLHKSPAAVVLIP